MNLREEIIVFKNNLDNWTLYSGKHISTSATVHYLYLRISASVKPLMFSRGMVRGRPRFLGLLRSDTESLSEPEYLRFRLRRPSFPLKLICKATPTTSSSSLTNNKQQQQQQQHHSNTGTSLKTSQWRCTCGGTQGTQCAECTRL